MTEMVLICTHFVICWGSSSVSKQADLLPRLTSLIPRPRLMSQDLDPDQDSDHYQNFQNLVLSCLETKTQVLKTTALISTEIYWQKCKFMAKVDTIEQFCFLCLVHRERLSEWSFGFGIERTLETVCPICVQQKTGTRFDQGRKTHKTTFD